MDKHQQAILNRFLTIPVGMSEEVQDYIDSIVVPLEQELFEFESANEDLHNDIENLETELKEVREELANLRYESKRQ